MGKWSYIYLLFWCDRKLPLDDYDLYEYVLNLLNLVAIAIKVVIPIVSATYIRLIILLFSKKIGGAL